MKNTLLLIFLGGTLFFSCSKKNIEDFEILKEKLTRTPDAPPSGGGGAVCQGAVWKVGDPQLDAYCGAAYAYRCKDGKPLSDPQVQAVCATYNDMKEPNVPECPYCK